MATENRSDKENLIPTTTAPSTCGRKPTSSMIRGLYAALQSHLEATEKRHLTDCCNIRIYTAAFASGLALSCLEMLILTCNVAIAVFSSEKERLLYFLTLKAQHQVTLGDRRNSHIDRPKAAFCIPKAPV